MSLHCFYAEVAAAVLPLWPQLECGQVCSENKLLTQKNRLKRRFFQVKWSEMGDSNSRPDGPKPPALPAALIPDFWLLSFCARCGQTCGQVVFLTTSTCGGNACIAGVSRDCGHSVFRLEGGATRSQTRRDTNFAIPGYFFSIPQLWVEGKRKFLVYINKVIIGGRLPADDDLIQICIKHLACCAL